MTSPKSEAPARDAPGSAADLSTLPLPECVLTKNSQACLEMAVAATQDRDRTYTYPTDKPHELSPASKGNKAVEKLQKQAKAIRDTLASMQKTLYKVNNPETYLELGLPGVSADFNNLLEQIRIQERRSPDEIENAERRSTIADLPKPAVVMVSSEAEMVAMLETIGTSLHAEPASMLSLDIEGADLSRKGTISMIQLYVPAVQHVYLVDIATLKEVAFTTSAKLNHGGLISLKFVLESSKITKLLWDCRADSDALNALYDVKLGGVVDVQLMDVATKTTSKERKRLSPLVQALPQRMKDELSKADIERWHAVKDLGKLAMAKDVGFERAQKVFQDCEGSIEKMRAAIDAVNQARRESASALKSTTVEKDNELDTPGHTALDAYDGITMASDPFVQRPLPQLLQEYASNDVIYLQALHQHYVKHQRWSETWRERVQEETEKRLVLSRSAEYEVGSTEHRGQAPEGWVDISETKAGDL